MQIQSCILALELCRPLHLPNGTVEYSLRPVDGRYLLFTTATFMCDEGFVLVGPNIAFCAFVGGTETSADWFDIPILTKLRPRCEGNKMWFF